MQRGDFIAYDRARKARSRLDQKIASTRPFLERLEAERATLNAEIEAFEREVRRLSPEWEPPPTPAFVLASTRQSYYERVEREEELMVVLRMARRPLSVREITQRVFELRGTEQPERGDVLRLRATLGSQLQRLEGKSVGRDASSRPQKWVVLRSRDRAAV